MKFFEQNRTIFFLISYFLLNAAEICHITEYCNSEHQIDVLNIKISEWHTGSQKIKNWHTYWKSAK